VQLFEQLNGLARAQVEVNRFWCGSGFLKGH
jgi:hypothetical protein